MWAVDTACVVPMQLIGRAYERAFEFRNATRKLYKPRVSAPWPEETAQPKPMDLNLVPFQSIDLSAESIPELVSRCAIDHLVPPVGDTRGGSVAGYDRWDEFKNHRLKRYADNRNDALKDASSRMSAYLHYGMVSPLRIAREADGVGGAGAEKYLEELLIWRELAYAFCFYRADHDRYTALPAWARETLEEHQKDRRPQQYTWEAGSRYDLGCVLERGAALSAAAWRVAQ